MISQTRDLESECVLKTTLRKVSYNPGDFKSPELNKWNNQI